MQRHEPWADEFVSSPENALPIVASGPSFPGLDGSYFDPINTTQMVSFAPAAVVDPARLIPDFIESRPGIFNDSNKRVRVKTFTEVMDEDDDDL